MKTDFSEEQERDDYTYNAARIILHPDQLFTILRDLSLLKGMQYKQNQRITALEEQIKILQDK